MGPQEIPPEIEATLAPEQRRAARRCLWVLGALGTASMVGVAASLYLANRSPLLLVALSPLGRHLILAASVSHPAAFLVVAVGRRFAFYVASFRLGRALGPAGIVWLESRAERTGRFIRWLERLFARAPRLVVVALPGPGVSTLAGIFGMRERIFAPLVVFGLTIRMALVVAVADWLREPIEQVLVWVDRNWIPGTVVIVTGLVAYQGWRRRSAALASRREAT